MTRPALSPAAWAILAALLLLPVVPTPAQALVDEADPALVLESGSVARRQLVGVGRDVQVHGEAREDVVALDGSIYITGRVQGDVVALGGSVDLGAAARVTGDVFAVGGTVQAQPGAQLEGRSVSYPDASAAWLTLLEGPTVGLSPFSPVVLGAKIALLAAWLLLVVIFFAVSGREVLATSESVSKEPFRGFVVGLTGVVTIVLTALLLTALSAALVGLPLLVLVVLLALVLKLWGMVAVFHALGDWLARRFQKRLTPLHAATLGLLVLGVLKFVPYVGVIVWTTATLIGVGATLSTKLGRREPWLQEAWA